MKTQTEALKMAIEALDTLMMEKGSIYQQALNACKEALEQPAQEPVAWMNINGKVRLDYKTEIIKSIAYKNKVKEIPLYTHPAPQPAQEPVAWMHETYTDGQKLLEVWCDTQEHKADDTITIPLYTHPAPEPECSNHPDAPHGFCRNASHSAGRYVCKCEGWEAEKPAQEPVGYIVPDYQDVMRLRDGYTLMAQEKTDLHKVAVYTHPAPSCSCKDKK